MPSINFQVNLCICGKQRLPTDFIKCGFPVVSTRYDKFPFESYSPYEPPEVIFVFGVPCLGIIYIMPKAAKEPTPANICAPVIVAAIADAPPPASANPVGKDSVKLEAAKLAIYGAANPAAEPISPPNKVFRT